MSTLSTWLLLVLTLPTENATARMRYWRALKARGCAVLRDGIYQYVSQLLNITNWERGFAAKGSDARIALSCDATSHRRRFTPGSPVWFCRAAWKVAR
ncbi:hypothetical protein [Paraburkholderia sp. BR14374]|uniref:hypothetical protein n=1 Tax=Paraburkholderia sp. BR14374 TaxID=3237007 RepID=UPI0034CD8C16